MNKKGQVLWEWVIYVSAGIFLFSWAIKAIEALFKVLYGKNK